MLDDEVLDAVARLIGVDDASAMLMRTLWAERDRFETALRQIAEWDLTHSEALTAKRAIEIAQAAVE